MEPGTIVNLKYFGEIDMGKVYQCNNLSGTIIFKGNEVSISIDFPDSAKAGPGRIAALAELFENLEAYDDNNIGRIKSDFESGSGPTAEYVTFCLDHLGENCLSGIINFENDRQQQEREVIEKLWLMEVYITLNPEQSHLVFFNYGLNSETYDYLSIYRDDKGEFQSLSVEG